MKKSLFQYRDYKLYLQEIFQSRAKGGRGEASRLAQYMNSQSAFISQVLNSTAHFNADQALLVAEYLGFQEHEIHFFLLLIAYARAGTEKLRAYYGKELSAQEEKHLQVTTHIQARATLSREDQYIYYSDWSYAAVHILVTIPAFTTPQSMSIFLQIPLPQLMKILDFLVSAGLLKEELGKYSVGTTSLHLTEDEPMIYRHHTNWRVRAIASLSPFYKNNLHHSGVVSLSREDFSTVKKIFIDAIGRADKTIAASKEECLAGVCVDLFEIRGCWWLCLRRGARLTWFIYATAIKIIFMREEHVGHEGNEFFHAIISGDRNFAHNFIFGF